ncbi:unnamed protein product [Cylicocyclus nassatus]|uniref:Uncharacterized protein n=1 Tax=Cylicocyclus nassatus TaxID=53992 RepID=A0AA36MD00_CYLNA|nr:unnamed protein product [Cylicocyclus nassatus]
MISLLKCARNASPYSNTYSIRDERLLKTAISRKEHHQTSYGIRNQYHILHDAEVSTKEDKPTTNKRATSARSSSGMSTPFAVSEARSHAIVDKAFAENYFRHFIDESLPSSSSSSQLQLTTTKNTVKMESPQLKVENLPELGGDDINQIMQCDEGEFLEIMSLVGMLSKTLHVRRLQRALTEFSKDQTSFNLAAIQQIGPPPVSPYALSGPDIKWATSLYAGKWATSLYAGKWATSLFCGNATTSPQNGNATHNSRSNSPLLCSVLWPLLSQSAAAVGSAAVAAGTPVPAPTSAAQLNSWEGETLWINERLISESLQGNGFPFLQSLSSSPVSVGGDFVSLGDYDPSTALCDSPVLSDAQIRRLSSCAMAICQKIPRLPPKLVQNKKRVSKEVLDLLSASADTPNRLAEYRKYSAIYGRFDAKRKPDKGLSFHEVSVNEAAAQLCLIMPSLLTRRDELFPLARQVVKDAGYHYAKASRKRGFDVVTHSPQSSPTQSPCPGEDNDAEADVFSTAKQSEEKRKKSESVWKLAQGGARERHVSGALGELNARITAVSIKLSQWHELGESVPTYAADSPASKWPHVTVVTCETYTPPGVLVSDLK